MNFKHAQWLGLSVLLTAFPLVGSAKTEDDLARLLAALAEPVVLQNAQGTDISGQALEVSRERVTLVKALATGSVEITYRAEEIFRVRLPGTEAIAQAQEWLTTGETEAGLRLFTAAHAQRAPFFPYLPSSEPPVFLELVQALVQVDTPKAARQAQTILRGLEPWLIQPGDQARWRDLNLLTTYLAQDYLAAAVLADAWMGAADRYAPSALGWSIAASLKLKADDPKAALRHALHPIVFSNDARLPFLPHAYAMAIKAAVKMDDLPLAHRLEHERVSRDLAWPKIIDHVTLPPIRDEFAAPRQ